MSNSSTRIYFVKALIRFSQALAIASIIRQQRIRLRQAEVFAEIQRQSAEGHRILREERSRAIVAAYEKTEKLESALDLSSKDRSIKASCKVDAAERAEQKYRDLISPALEGVRSVDL